MCIEVTNGHHNAHMFNEMPGISVLLDVLHVGYHSAMIKTYITVVARVLMQ